MPRRRPYTNVRKSNRTRARHIVGMGDVVFRGFECLNSECQFWIFVREDELGVSFDIPCPSCGFVHSSGGAVKFYDYQLVNTNTGDSIEDGQFIVSVDDYLKESGKYKYCIICNARKPLEMFDRHSARVSGRQGECSLCKTVYNGIKNQTRIADQHREAAQKRRMYVDLTGSRKIDSAAILRRFEFKCFKCGLDLSDPDSDRHLDHTLPVSYLWPLTTNNATLLCGLHNGQKADRWPSDFYSDPELRRLTVATGISYELLRGPVEFNPEALDALRDPAFVDSVLAKYAPYIDELIKVRNRVLRTTGFDFLSVSPHISPDILRRADEHLPRP